MTTETKIQWTKGNRLDPQDVMARAKIHIKNELHKHLIRLIREYYNSEERDRLGYSREEIENMAQMTYKELIKSVNL